MLGLNTGAISNAAAPFGGVKQSGLGREGGLEGIQKYLYTQYIPIPNPTLANQPAKCRWRFLCGAPPGNEISHAPVHGSSPAVVFWSVIRFPVTISSKADFPS